MEPPKKESIYNLVDQPVPQPKKKARYVSKHSGNCPPIYSTFCLAGTSKPGIANAAGETTKPKGSAHVYEKPAAYLGPPLGTLKPEPTLILQKQSKAPFVESLKDIKRKRPEQLQTIRHKEKLKAPTPLKSEKPIMGIRSDRNFITLNALNNIFSKPKKTPESQCDWTKKPDYGRVPKYLEAIKKVVAKEYAYIDTLRQPGAKTVNTCVDTEHVVKWRKRSCNTSKCPSVWFDLPESIRKSDNVLAEECGSPHNGGRVLPDSERQKLLAGLKERWNELNSIYQNTTHVVLLDTIGKARRKEQLEEQLSTIERYIDKLNTGKTIVVRPE